MATAKTIEPSALQPYTEGVADVTTQYISRFTLPNGSTAYIKDALGRQAIANANQEIANIKEAIDGGTHFLGVTTTALTDGATTNPVIIEGESVTAEKGDFVIVANSGSEPYIEFIWTGSAWTELGSTGSLKALAYKDSASGTYTPAGTVTVDYTPEGNVTIPAITPAGTISKPDVTVTPVTAADFGYVASATYADETLTLSMATVSSMVTGVSAELSAAPTFTGTTIDATSVALDGTAAATNIATYTGTEATITVS